MQNLSSSFGSSSLTKSRIKSVGSALAAAVLFGTIMFSPDVDDDSMTDAQRENGHVNYLNQRGCDGEAFRRGEMIYCPD